MDDKPEIKQDAPINVDVPANDHSVLFGVSIRGWIAMVVVFTVCGMSWTKVDIKEPLYTLAGLIVGFYFGQNTKKTQ